MSPDKAGHPIQTDRLMMEMSSLCVGLSMLATTKYSYFYSYFTCSWPTVEQLGRIGVTLTCCKSLQSDCNDFKMSRIETQHV